MHESIPVSLSAPDGRGVLASLRMPFYARTLFITVAPREAEEAVRGHLAHVADLKSRGKLHAAGELGRGDGFLEIISVRDLKEADALARESPLIEQGLASWMIREWTPIGETDPA